jgi:hypothetical protein
MNRMLAEVFRTLRAAILVFGVVFVGCTTDHEVWEPRLTVGIYRGKADQENFRLYFSRFYSWTVERHGEFDHQDGVVDDAVFAEVDLVFRREELPAYVADPNVFGARPDEAFGSATRPLYRIVIHDDPSQPERFQAWIVDGPETHEPTKGLLRRADAILAKVGR